MTAAAFVFSYLGEGEQICTSRGLLTAKVPRAPRLTLLLLHGQPCGVEGCSGLLTLFQEAPRPGLTLTPEGAPSGFHHGHEQLYARPNAIYLFFFPSTLLPRFAAVK